MMTSFSNSHSSRSVDVCAVKEALKNISPDKYYTFDRVASWHIMSDDMNFIYVLICKKEYSQRCAYLCLQELQSVFRAKVGVKALSSEEGGLNDIFQSELKKVCEKYESTSSIDSLTSTMKKVDEVKLSE